MEQNYKKLYKDAKKQLDRFVKHKRTHAKYCRNCSEFYKEVLEHTQAIKDKGTRDALTRLWKTLWINHEDNFDIILYELDWEVMR